MSCLRNTFFDNLHPGANQEAIAQQLSALTNARANARRELGPTMPQHVFARRNKRLTDDDAAEERDDAGSFYYIEVEYGSKVERSVIAALSLPEIYVVRSKTPEGVKAMGELSSIARQLSDVAPNAGNVDLFINWLQRELVDDCFLLIECYYDAVDPDPATKKPMRAEDQAYYEAEILSNISYVSELFAILTSSSEGLANDFFSETISNIKDEVRQRNVDKVFPFLIDQLGKDSKLLEAVCTSMPHAKAQFFTQVMDEVVEPFVNDILTQTEKVLDLELQKEGKLSPRSRRAGAARVADSFENHQTLLADMSASCTEFVKNLIETHEAQSQADALKESVSRMFDARRAKSAMQLEPELLRRRFNITSEHYIRKLERNLGTDGSFSVREAHHTKAQEYFKAANASIKRQLKLSSAVEVGGMVKYLCSETLSKLVTFAKEELRKMFDTLKADVGTWTKPVKSTLQASALAATSGEQQAPEPIAAGLEMVMWVQGLFVEYDMLCERHCKPLLPQFPMLLVELDSTRDAALEDVDAAAQDVTRLCAAGLVTKVLSILLNEQKKEDYKPKEAKKAKGVTDDEPMIAPDTSPACAWACTLLSSYLTQAAPFLHASVEDEDTVGSPREGKDSKKRAQHFRTQSQGGGDPNADLQGDSVDGTPLPRDVDVRTALLLRPILQGDWTGGKARREYGASFNRTIGIALYRGISAHLRGFIVNDRGALVLKKDVAAFREAVEPLCRGDSDDSRLITGLFNVLKEAANLLLVPLDHIKSVKSSGLLSLLSDEEKQNYLKMRDDLRKAFKQIDG